MGQKKQKSLSTKISLWIVLFSGLIFLAALGLFFNESRIAVQKEAIKNASLTLDNTIQHINTILTEVMANNEYDMAFDYTAFYNDPELFVGRQFQASGIGAKNYAHYVNPEVDDLMVKAKATLNEDERMEYYHQLNKILCDDCPWIGMFNNNLYALARTGIKGVNLNVETTYWYNTIRYEE